MKFKNLTEKSVKIRLDERDNTDKATSECKWRWRTIQPNEVIDMPKEYGERLGFVPVRKTEEIILVEDDKAKPELPKRTINEKYLAKVLDIQGIGPKTAKDVVVAYPTEKDLKDAIKSEDHLPLRNDIAEKLEKAFG